jgi:hypothetical protein
LVANSVAEGMGWLARSINLKKNILKYLWYCCFRFRSYGVVYKGTWRESPVAIKEALLDSAAARADFFGEAELMLFVIFQIS